MRFIDADDVHARLPWGGLLQSIREIVGGRDDVGAPERFVFPVGTDPMSTQTMLVMPAWHDARLTGVKVVTHVPANGSLGLPTVNATYLAFDGVTGALLATLDGEALTVRRTAALSALGSISLVRPSAERLLIIGTGELAPMLAQAHLHSHGFRAVEVWGRNPQRARATAATIEATLPGDVELDVADELAAAIRRADVIVSATGSPDPLIHRRDVAPGTHVSLIGSYKSDMCEADADLMAAATVFADTRPGALGSGELSRPIAAGRLDASVVVADLGDLVTGRHPGRTSDDEITVFKAAGFALADLAAAQLVLASPQIGE